MALPILGVLALLGIGAGGAISIGTTVANNWDSIRRELFGKSIAVLGPRQSGKTTLVRFLSSGEFVEVHETTNKPEKHTGKTIELQDLKLDLLDLTDVPGETQFHKDWEAEYGRAEIALYLFDAGRVQAGDQDYERTIKGDMRHIGEWFESRRKKPPQFFLVATHCDLIKEYAALPKGRETQFTDTFWKRPVPQALINYARAGRNVRCVAGSLKTHEGIERVVADILSQLAE